MGNFDDVYRDHYRYVYSLCLRILKDHHEAEDLAQETFVQVFRKQDSYKGNSTFRTWLYRVTQNQCLMYLRTKKKKFITDPLDEILETPALPGLSPQKRIDLERAMSQMPPGYKRSLILHDFFGYEHAECAELSGVSIGTSKSQLSKARLKLTRLLKKKANPRLFVVESPEPERTLPVTKTHPQPLNTDIPQIRRPAITDMTLRQRAVQKVLRRYQHTIYAKCIWCQKTCVWWQKLPKEAILDAPSSRDLRNYAFPEGIVTFRRNGKIHKYPAATVDHLQEVSKGGRNNDDNLVVSCKRCNAERSTPPHSGSAKGAMKCVQCGSFKLPKSKRRCKPCLADNERYHRSQQAKAAAV